MKEFIKKISIFSLILSAIIIFISSIINYTLDPYGLIGSISNDYKTEPNMRSLKNWYISENNLKQLNLFFSNSRGGTYIFKDSSYYNMSYSMGVTPQFHEDIKDHIDNGVDIKSIIIMIDELSIYNDGEMHAAQPLRKKYNKKDLFSFFMIPPSGEKILDIFSPKNKKHIKFNLKKDGSQEYKNFNISQSLDTIQIQIPITYPSLKTKKAFYDLKKLINYLNSKNIDAYIGIHPISYYNFQKNTDKIIQLKSLVSLLNTNNIKCFNNLTIINDNEQKALFYDSNHYSPVLAKLVIDQLIQYENKK